MNEFRILSNDVSVKDFMFCHNLYIHVITSKMIRCLENAIENQTDLLSVIRDLLSSLYPKQDFKVPSTKLQTPFVREIISSVISWKIYTVNMHIHKIINISFVKIFCTICFTMFWVKIRV